MLANEMDRSGDERRSPVAKAVEEKGDDQPKNERVECIELIEHELDAWIEC